MKKTISTYSLSRWRREQGKSLEQALAWAAEQGLDAIEFSGLDEKAGDQPLRRAKQLRRRCDQLGLKVVSYCVGAELLRKPQEQQAQVAQLREQVDVAATLGVRTMRHDVTRGFRDGWSGPRTFAAALKCIVPAIREVADYAAKQGLKTSLENHGFYMQASTRVAKLIETVDHPNYGLTMDCGNFLCVNEDPLAAVRRLAKYAIMVHVKDFHVKPKNQAPWPAKDGLGTGWFATPTPIALRGAVLGHGVVNVPKQLEVLKKVGYRGYLSLEFEGIEEPTHAVRLGLQYLDQCLASLQRTARKR